MKQKSGSKKIVALLLILVMTIGFVNQESSIYAMYDEENQIVIFENDESNQLEDENSFEIFEVSEAMSNDTNVSQPMSNDTNTSQLISNDINMPELNTFILDNDLSEEEYQQKKAELFNQTIQPALFSISSNRLYNEYIEFAVNSTNGRYTIGTTGGNPEVSADNNKLLLYGHPNPSTSYTTIYVDGKTYKYGDDGFITKPYFSGNSNTSEAKFGDISVKQVISIVNNNSTNREDVVEVKYIVSNEGNSLSYIGLRIMMDTMLGSNDAAPFRIPGVGDVTTEMEFTGESIPQYWQAFDSLSNPNVVAYGNFISGDIKPDKVQFTNWSRVYNNPWNYTISKGSSNGDSAVSIIWDRVLLPGMEETYVTRYGLSELLQDLAPPLAFTIAADRAVQVDTLTHKYVPYTVTAYVQNTGSASATNVNCKLSLPEELMLKTGDSLVVNLGNVNVGEVKKVEKTVYVKETKTG